MSSNAFETRVVWRRSGPAKRELRVIGRRLNPGWTQQSVETLQVRFSGSLYEALRDLLTAAKNEKSINLPVVRLRASLMAGLDGVIALDRDLGVLPRTGAPAPPALEMYPPVDGTDGVAQGVLAFLKRWCLDVLEPWAAIHAFDDLARRVKRAVVADNMMLSPAQRTFIRKTAEGPRLDFALAVREIAERLAGEALFTDERGPCEIVVAPEASANFVELMTPPRLGADGRTPFSMVARVSIVTVPYAAGYFLKVAAMKRVWATRVPGNKPNAPRRLTAYVTGPGRPVLPVSVLRTKDGWQFGDDYLSVRLLADGGLPATLEEAVARQKPDDSSWWVGLPELTTLFDHVSPRTVFEADEVDLLEAVARRLKGVAEAPIDFMVHKLPRGQAKTIVKMLKLTDVGVAGAALDADSADTDDDSDETESANLDIEDKLAVHRDQNIRALELVHAGSKPTLWCFGGTPEEQDLISKSVKALFGEAIAVKTEVLPSGVHGLKANLPAADGSAQARFEARIEAWKPVAERIASQNGPRFALICAPDREGRKSEDIVNYYAGLHAMCAFGQANVHHVLPIASSEAKDSKQNFIHRLQSALLDVFLAHSGIVFGVKEFLEERFNGNPPKATYGIQAVRSRARPFSGESDVYFAVATRLITTTGATEVQFFHKDGSRNRTSSWFPLAEGLRWLGAQRRLSAGDGNWLKAAFPEFARDLLTAIGRDDPRALVLIDWENVAGLWKGIRDEDLVNSAPPKLNGGDLAHAFPQMSLVRVRRGFDVLSLRVISRATYEAWRAEPSREITGERYIDEYPTTTKSLVEFVPSSAARQPCGHFVASMGYSKTSQVKRGFSCYRSMPRMFPVKGTGSLGERRARFFEKNTLEAANMDASVPAPLDITVLSCPADVSPSEVAVAVMGLRLGYAHYSDWTTLPAPLFFKRKIEDYIIRYRDEGVAQTEAGAEEQEPQTTVGNVEEPSTPTAAQTDLAQAVVESVLPPRACDVVATYEVARDVADATIDTEDASHVDPLSKAKRSRVLALYESDDPKVVRLYEAMLQDNGAHIRVALPSFVSPKEAFDELAVSKRHLQRAWARMRDFGFVNRNRAAMPSRDGLAEWMTQRLIRPQAAHSLFIVGLGGPLFFRPVQSIIERYNLTATEPLTLSPGTFRNLKDVSEWACERSDDYAVAWLLFAAAQFPGYGSARNILAGISLLPGAMSEEALQYFVDCAEACREAVANKHLVGRHFPNIVKRRPAPPGAARVSPTSHRAVPAMSEAVAVQNASPVSIQQDESITEEVMNVDCELLNALRALEPGSETFAPNIEHIRARLVELEARHKDLLEQQARLSKERQRAHELEERAVSLLEQVEAQRHAPSRARIALRLPFVEPAERISQQLDAVAAAIEGVKQRRDDAEALSARPLPAGASWSDRKRRAEQEAQVFGLVDGALAALEEAVSACSVFTVNAVSADEADVDTSNVSAPSEGEGPTGSGEVGSEDLAATNEAVPVTEGVLAAADEVQAAVAAVAAPIQTPTQLGRTARVDADAPDTDRAANAGSEADVDEASDADDTAEPVRLDSAARGSAFDTLFKLVNQRRYALASIHVRALAQLLPKSEFEAHRIVLNALFNTLDSVDCNFAVDLRLDAELGEFLRGSPSASSKDCNAFAFSAGVLGAGVVNMLFEAQNRDGRWNVLSYLQGRFAGHRALNALTEHIGKLDRTGIVLTRDAFAASRIGVTSAMDAELKRMRQRAAQWRHSTEIHSLWNNHTWRNIHEEMFSPRYAIGQCLTLIADGNFERVKQIYGEVKKKFDKPAATLDELTRRTRTRVAPDGKPRVWFMENLATTAEFVGTCMELVHKRASPNADLPSNVLEYLEVLYETLRAAVDELHAVTTAHPVERIYADSAAAVLRSILRLFDETQAPKCVPSDQQLLLVQLPMNRDFVPSMGPAVDGQLGGMVCAPEEALQETRRLCDEALEIGNASEESGLEPALRDAARSHAENNRFLPAFAIERIYPGTFGSGENSLNALHQRARVALDAELHEARQRVAHAMALSALETAEANRMLRLIEDIRAANSARASIGQIDAEYQAYPDFPHARAALRRGALDILDARLTDSRAKLSSQVDAYEAEHGHEAGRDIARIREMLQAHNASSLRAAYDAFAMLKNEGRLPPPTPGPTDAADEYQTWMASLKASLGTTQHTLDVLRRRLARDPSGDDPDWLRPLDQSAREEARQFLESWAGLFQPLPLAEPSLQAFFKALGLPATPVTAHDGTYVGRRVRFYFDGLPFGPGTDAFFVPPDLGSRASHVQGFVLLSQPQSAHIQQLIQDAGASPTLLLARTSLSLEERAKLSVRTPVLLLDDDLVVYMALHPTQRVRKLLGVSLLTYCTNPYGDYGGVPVPPEMFFGRDTELKRLRQVQNAGILYGGRRLGKSSLLDQIQREGKTHPGSAAVYVSLDGAKFETDYVLYAWKTVYGALCSHGVIQRVAPEPKTWKGFQDVVEKGLASRKDIRSCYLLLDEADALMGHELNAPKDAPSFVRSLQHVCEAVQKSCHLRYVIAGLHNVARMSTEENSPLGKAEAIALEPFSTAEDVQRGVELVTKPLAALGFFFEKGSEDLPLRILSVCNFYPAFIQLYCRVLLERLYNVRQDKRPPHFVTAKDLDAVERDGNLLTELQRKFELNLNLDKRYKAIALVLADVYYADTDASHYAGLTTSQIREYCETYAPAHFAKTGPGVYEALVDEMRKLNVLERVGPRYVLRNPNIAMMMGDRDRISHLIDELARETPEQARNQGERRIFLRRNGQRQIFPLPAAWVRTNVDVNDGELIILVGNELSGLAEIATLPDEWTFGQEGVYIVRSLPSPRSAESLLRQWKAGPNTAVSKRLIAAQSWNVSLIAEYARIASRNRQARLALLALPDKAYELAQAICSGLVCPGEGDGAGVRIVPVPPWTEDAVHFHLDENVAVAENSDACRALLDATCGFGKGIERLCSRHLTMEEARASVARAEREFAPDLETFYTRIGMPGAVDAGTRRRMYDFLKLLDDGVDKKSSTVQEAMHIASVDEGLVHFLAWMGLLQDGPGNTWRVPGLVRRLLI